MNPHIENYFKESASSLLGEVLYYHLTLEALLTELIRSSGDAPSERILDRMTFKKKADECFRMGKLTSSMHGAVSELNKVRNRYAHELGYKITFEEVLALANQCGAAGVEFTDNVNGATKAQAQEMGYETLGLLHETFTNTFFEVANSQKNEAGMNFIV